MTVIVNAHKRSNPNSFLNFNLVLHTVLHHLYIVSGIDSKQNILVLSHGMHLSCGEEDVCPKHAPRRKKQTSTQADGTEARWCPDADATVAGAVGRDEDDEVARCFSHAVRLSIRHMPSATRSVGPPRLKMRHVG